MGLERMGASVILNVTTSPKMLRETLCRAQSLTTDPYDIHRLQLLINECDRHRPLGPDGKHGNRHTVTCGCEDK